MIKIKILVLLVFTQIYFFGCQENKKIDQIYITTDQDISSQKTKINLQINQNKDIIQGTIKTRGGYSINFPKKSYEIDLENDISLLGLPEDDDWILNANFIDKTFLRHVVSYELFQDMRTENKISKTKYVEILINNQYEGLYVLMQKLDKSTLEIEEKQRESVIFKDPHIFRESYSNIVPQKENNFHQQVFPKLFKSNKNHFIEEIRDFILNSSDSMFNEYIGDVFDINNIADWHLLLLITNNSDGVLKNFYLYKLDNTTPLRISPWDYDHSFGRDGDNELNINVRKVDLKRSILFSRLLSCKWYKNLLKQRWIALNKQNILSVKGLKNRISNKYSEIDEFIIKNTHKWPTTNNIYYDDNSANDEIKIMFDFIDSRHLELNQYFNNILE